MDPADPTTLTDLHGLLLSPVGAVSVRLVVAGIAVFSVVSTIYRAVTLRLGPVALASRALGTVLAIGLAVWVVNDPAAAVMRISDVGAAAVAAALAWVQARLGGPPAS